MLECSFQWNWTQYPPKQSHGYQCSNNIGDGSPKSEEEGNQIDGIIKREWKISYSIIDLMEEHSVGIVGRIEIERVNFWNNISH